MSESNPNVTTLPKSMWIDLEPDADKQFIDALGEDKLKALESFAETLVVLPPVPRDVYEGCEPGSGLVPSKDKFRPHNCRYFTVDGPCCICGTAKSTPTYSPEN